jgi:outer membrane protein assembly factor BamB
MTVMRMALLSCLALVLAESAGLAQPSAGGGSPLPSEALLNQRGLTRKWWNQAIINSSRDMVAHVVNDEENVFVQSRSGTITAYDSESGKQLWARTIGATDRPVQAPAISEDMLLVINGLMMYGVKKSNGDRLWEVKLPGQPSSSAALDEERIFIGFLDGSVYAFELSRIRKLWNEGKLPRHSPETIAWRFRSSKSVVAPPVPDGKLVAFISHTGSLYTVTSKDRETIFQYETDAPLSAPIVRYHDDLLLASQDSNFYALNVKTGRLGWQFTTGNVIRKPPVLIDDEVYLIPEDGRLFKLSPKTGKEIWDRPQRHVHGFLAASSDLIFVVGSNNVLEVHSRETGELEGSVPLGRFTRHVTNIHSDRIFVATDTGLVMCLHERGRAFPRYHLHPERQPVLPEVAPEGSEATSAE